MQLFLKKLFSSFKRFGHKAFISIYTVKPVTWCYFWKSHKNIGQGDFSMAAKQSFN